MSLTAFFKESAVKVESVEYEVSKRFKDENGQPIKWRLRVLDMVEYDKITQGAKTRTLSNATGEKTMNVDGFKLRNDLVLACVEYPNLADSQLQDSYSAVGEIDLLKKMLTPGEFTGLIEAVQQAQGFELGMKEAIEEAKN